MHKQGYGKQRHVHKCTGSTHTHARVRWQIICIIWNNGRLESKSMDKFATTCIAFTSGIKMSIWVSVLLPFSIKSKTFELVAKVDKMHNITVTQWERITTNKQCSINQNTVKQSIFWAQKSLRNAANNVKQFNFHNECSPSNKFHF